MGEETIKERGCGAFFGFFWFFGIDTGWSMDSEALRRYSCFPLRWTSFEAHFELVKNRDQDPVMD